MRFMILRQNHHLTLNLSINKSKRPLEETESFEDELRHLHTSIDPTPLHQNRKLTKITPETNNLPKSLFKLPHHTNRKTSRYHSFKT